VAPVPTAAAPVPATPTGPARALNIEFVTVRPVWARITVDGRRAMEREFAADQRFMFGADRAIAIAGDAGVQLIVDGKDLVCSGRHGQVFSLTITAQTLSLLCSTASASRSRDRRDDEHLQQHSRW
jgi:hypothetical protein